MTDNPNWGSEISLSDKLFAPVLRDMFIELITIGDIRFGKYLSNKYNHSYMQIYKYKYWLLSKGLIEIQRIGKKERMSLSTKGQLILNAFKKLYNTIKEVEQDG